MLEVELSPINLGNQRDESSGVLSIFIDEAGEAFQELALVQTTKCAAFNHGIDANTGV